MFNFLVHNAEWVAVVGGFVAVVGTILVNIKSKRESTANETKQSELLRLSIKLNDNITGGDSYPMVTFFDMEEEFGIPQFSVANRGNYPLYLTQMIITDEFETQKILDDPNNKTSRGIPADLFEPFKKVYELSEIIPGNALMMNTFPFQMKEGKSFSVTFTARNGTFTQAIIPHKRDGKWIVAHRSRKFDGKTNPILFKYVPDNFPRNLLTW